MPSVDPSQKSFTIRVPGTTSNLGPGFDCLGAALDLHNLVEVFPSDSLDPPHPMVAEAVDTFHASPKARDLPRRSLGWTIRGEVPISRGLGSSVTLRLGILAGANALAGFPLDQDELFRLCSELEGHPDNAGPAVYGGFFVGGPDGSHFHFPVNPDLRFILLIRQHEVLTDEARLVLPPQIGFPEAVENVGRVAAVTAAFAAQDYASLRGLLKDNLHEPYRAALNPRLPSIIEAGEKAGALGGFLSGSGSTVACLTADADQAGDIADAMVAACADEQEPVIRIAAVDNEGLDCQPRGEGRGEGESN